MSDDFVSLDAGLSAMVTSSTMTIQDYPPPHKLSFACGDKYIDINLSTGEVSIPDNLTTNQAAIAFWRAVTEAFPEVRNAIRKGTEI